MQLLSVEIAFSLSFTQFLQQYMFLKENSPIQSNSLERFEGAFHLLETLVLCVQAKVGLLLKMISTSFHIWPFWVFMVRYCTVTQG